MDGLKENFEVDLVYLWVDGNDPVWRQKRAPYVKESYSDSEMASEARYQDNGELKYSLRSVEKFAPWIRKIFIVTDNQVPEWLDTSNPKIKIIDHTDILPEQALPCFNSTVIEHFLYKIPDLAEHFLYSNDDMFFNKPVFLEDFFTPDGRPIVRLNRRIFRKFWLNFHGRIMGKKTSYYNRVIENAAELVERATGKYIGHKSHHNIDAYRKSDYTHTFETFENDIATVIVNHIRNDNDIERLLYSFFPITEKKAKVKFVTQKESYRCHIEHKHHITDMDKFSPMLFCVNDSQDADRESHEMVAELLNRKFPNKSRFEK